MSCEQNYALQRMKLYFRRLTDLHLLFCLKWHQQTTEKYTSIHCCVKSFCLVCQITLCTSFQTQTLWRRTCHMSLACHFFCPSPNHFSGRFQALRPVPGCVALQMSFDSPQECASILVSASWSATACHFALSFLHILPKSTEDAQGASSTRCQTAFAFPLKLLTILYCA